MLVGAGAAAGVLSAEPPWLCVQAAGHEQRQSAPGQEDSIRVMGEASALQALQRRGGEEGRP